MHVLIVDGEPVWPILNYFRSRSLDLSTEAVYAQATGMLIDFIAAKGNDFVEVSKRGSLFTAFAHAVLNGTIRDGNDETGLWWHPRSNARALKLVRLVCEVSDWLQSTYNATAINPFTNTATAAEKIAFWRRCSMQKAGALLGHLKRSKKGTEDVAGRRHALPGSAPTVIDSNPDFPEEHIERLLFEGFVKRGGRRGVQPWQKWNIRDMMVTLLLHYGGLRVSEPFHLWVDDVFVNPNNPAAAKVLVHHPHDGIHEYPDPITGRKATINRADALRTLYGREPLTEATGKRHAGWKDSLLTNQERMAFEVFWYPQAAGELFMTLYRMYLKYVRPATSRHPWLFVTENGEPMGTGTFIKNHEAAVRRIGLDPAKHAGTSRHGHRHSYGKRLRKSGVSKKVIQVAMHHCSALSQEVYTAADVIETRNALDVAARSLPAADLNFQLPLIEKKKA